MIKRFAPVAFSLVMVGCTTTDEIIIDEKGVDMTRYQSDLEQCQVYSE